MSSWLSILLGLVGGLIVIGGVFYWAFRPRDHKSKSNLPSARDPGITYDAGLGVQPPQD